MNKLELSRALLQGGFTIRPQALEALAEYLTTADIRDLTGDEFCEIQEKLGKCTVIDVGDIQALYDLPQRMDRDWMLCLNVVRDLEHYVYSPEEEDFLPQPTPCSFPLSDYSSIHMMQERLLSIRAQLKTNKLFDISDRRYGQPEPRIDLITVDALVGSIQEKVVLGVLNQVDEGTWMLEDPTGSVRVSLSQLDPPIYGYYPSGSVVLMQGEYVDGLFSARAVVQPPVGQRVGTKADLYGSEKWRNAGKEEKGKAVRMKTEVRSIRVVVLADIHIDDYSTMTRLETVFEGYQSYSNLVFLLIGDFLSLPTVNSEVYLQSFQRLVDLICKFEVLKEKCYWVLVPGPNDIGLGNVYPKDAFPELFLEPFQQLSNFMSGSNPSRVEICGVKMVVFSTDFIRQLRRHSAVQPCEEMPSSHHLVHTVLRQGHLTPGSEVTTIWELDYALRLQPLPDILIYSDKCDPFIHLDEGCLALNPASFSHDSTFLFIDPALKTAEECSIPL